MRNNRLSRRWKKYVAGMIYIRSFSAKEQHEKSTDVVSLFLSLSLSLSLFREPFRVSVALTGGGVALRKMQVSV